MSDETTGTPGATQEGANAEASGTPAASTDGGNAAALSDADKQELERLRRAHEQHLAEKSNYEEAQRRLQQLESERQQRGWGYPPPTAYDPAQSAAMEAAQAIQSLQERDPEAARAMLALAGVTQQELARRDAEFQRRDNEARFEREMSAVPAKYHDRVRSISKQKNIWPSLALSVVRDEEYAAKEREIADRERKLQEEAERRQKGVVRTDSAPAPPAPNNNGTITRSAYAKAARDAATTRDPEALRLMREYDAGRLKLVEG